jgi:DNA-binding response OmpR family regulator
MFVQDHVVLEGMPFALAARRSKSIRNPLMPILAVFTRARQSDVESARDLGVNDVICRPMAPKTVMDKLQSALMAPRPFIAAPDFFGPDRRAAARAAMGFRGRERRSRTPRKARIGRAETEYQV